MINKEQIRKAVKESINYSDLARRTGRKVAGGTISHLKKFCERHEIDTSHFLGKASTKGKPSKTKLAPEEILVLIKDPKSYRQRTYKLKRALLEIGIEYKCNLCNISNWLDKEITLDIDHINSNWMDNRKDNLQFLCPNCHRQKTKYKTYGDVV